MGHPVQSLLSILCRPVPFRHQQRNLPSMLLSDSSDIVASEAGPALACVGLLWGAWGG